MVVHDECQILEVNATSKVYGWEGIPEAIILNALIAGSMFFALFVIRAIYYHRKPYYNDWNIGWLQFIYSDRNVEQLHNEDRINRLHPNAYLAPCLHAFAEQIKNKLQDTSQSSSLYVSNNLEEKIKEKHQAKLDSTGKNRCWLLDYILISDRDILEHRGKDAYQYLIFQRYIIYFLIVLSAVSVIILMPLNIAGQNGEKGYYAMTTINNINADSNVLWVHAILTVSMAVFGVFVMKKFYDLIVEPIDEMDERTILIQNIPRDKRNCEMLKEFIERKFKGINVTRITFTYDVETLKNLCKQAVSIQSSLYYCEKYEEAYGQPLRVNPAYCNCCCGQKVHAISYYSEQDKEYKVTIQNEVTRTLPNEKHAIFVQLRNEVMAQRILDHFDHTQHERLFKRFLRMARELIPCISHHETDPFEYNNWMTRAAPIPEDIEWSDIVSQNTHSILFSLLPNILLAIIFIFLSTPVVAINFLDDIMAKTGLNNTITQDWNIAGISINFAQYISATLMNAMSSVLPTLIALIESYIPRVTKSEKSHKIMIVVYVYLILMVIVLPSLNLMSGRLLIQQVFASNQMPKHIYKCLFPAKNSLFFVNYVISSAFINNTCLLMRFSELFKYFYNCIIYARTEAEYKRARMETYLEFSYSSSYPMFLLIFTMVTTYSIACPIIVPFGLLYMIVRNLVDRYMLYYMYSTPVINPNVHQTAISFVLIAYFFMLLQVGAFFNTKISPTIQLNPPNLCNFALAFYILFLCFSCANFSNLSRPRNRWALDAVTSRMPRASRAL